MVTCYQDEQGFRTTITKNGVMTKTIIRGKKMKITLAHTSPKRKTEEGDLYPRLNRVEGAGIAYLGSYLEDQGYDVKLISEMDESEKETLDQIVESKPDVVGFYAFTSTFPRVVNYSKLIKERLGKDVKIVVGADHVSANPSHSLQGKIDFAVRGEGELTLTELVKKIESKETDYENIDGLIYKKDGKVIINSPRARIKDLDSLPFPKRDRDLLDITTIGMLSYPKIADQKSAASVLTSRGCPYSCEFCSSDKIWGSSVIQRSSKNIVNELKLLQENYGTNVAFFPDLTFNAKQKRVFELSDAIKEAKLDMSLYVVMRLMSPNWKKLISYDMLKSMRKANFRKIGFGIESLAPSIQNERVKKTELSYAKEIFDYCNDLGIITKSFIILGYPEETKETLQETTENLKYILPDELRISFLTPFPGTRLYDESKDKLITTDLTKFDTNTPLIRNDSLSPQDFIEARKKMYADYFNSAEYLKRAEDKCIKHPELKGSYDEYFGFLKDRRIMK